MALVEDIDGNETKVRLSSGAAGEVFAGVSMSRNAPPTVMPNVEEGSIPTSLSVRLARTPIAGQLLVKVEGTAKTVVAGAPASAAEVQLVDDVLNFFAGENAKALLAQYAYEPTLVEARTFVGDSPVGGLSSSVQSVIGVLAKAEFGTNMFDASSDWSTALNVKLGADGKFTTTGSGTLLTNVVIRNRPSSSNSMLVLAIN